MGHVLDVRHVPVRCKFVGVLFRDPKFHQTLFRCTFYDHFLHPGSPTHTGPVAHSGGPDGVRTRDHRIKSPTLYLTELQAQCSNLGFSPDLQGVFIHFAMLLSQHAALGQHVPQRTQGHKPAQMDKKQRFARRDQHICS